MERNVTFSDKAVKDGKAVLVTHYEETLTEMDVRNNIQALDRQMYEVRQQMINLKKKYDELGTSKQSFEELLKSMTEELPEIK